MPANFSYVISGKLAGSARPGDWEDLFDDLSELAEQGIGAIVSLTETPLDPAPIQYFKFASLHLPIPDFTPPSQQQIAAFAGFVDNCLAEGKAVVVHCGAGIGRTGAMLAAYLVHTGMDAEDALATVRNQRPGSVETREQADSVREYAASLGRPVRHGRKKHRR